MAPRAVRIRSPASLCQHPAAARQGSRRVRATAGKYCAYRSKRWPHHCTVARILSEALLDEVSALVEWPVAIAGQFEARFLSLPREVLISTLQEHQRYFALEDAAGTLLPWFITVSNIDSPEPAEIRAGNERVVRPRLADAEFFWEQDRRQPLGARLAGLAAVTFQAQLGSQASRTAAHHRARRSHRRQHRRAHHRQRSRGRAVQMRSADGHGAGVPGIAGHHGPLLRVGRWRTGGGRRGHS